MYNFKYIQLNVQSTMSLEVYLIIFKVHLWLIFRNYQNKVFFKLFGLFNIPILWKRDSWGILDLAY